MTPGRTRTRALSPARTPSPALSHTHAHTHLSHKHTHTHAHPHPRAPAPPHARTIPPTPTPRSGESGPSQSAKGYGEATGGERSGTPRRGALPPRPPRLGLGLGTAGRRWPWTACCCSSWHPQWPRWKVTYPPRSKLAAVSPGLPWLLRVACIPRPESQVVGEHRPRPSAGLGRHPPARPRLAFGARSWFAEPSGSRARALLSSPGLPQLGSESTEPAALRCRLLSSGETGVGEEGASRAVRPLEYGRQSARFLSRARMLLGSRAPPLLFLRSGSAGSRTRPGGLALRAGTGEALPRYLASGCRMRGAEFIGPTLGGQLVVPEPAGCIFPGSVGAGWTRLSPLAPENGGGVGCVISSDETRPVSLRPGKVADAQRRSPCYFSLGCASAAVARKARSAGTAPGAAGRPALGGARESLWEIPAPLPPPAPFPRPLPRSTAAAAAPSRNAAGLERSLVSGWKQFWGEIRASAPQPWCPAWVKLHRGTPHATPGTCAAFRAGSSLRWAAQVLVQLLLVAQWNPPPGPKPRDSAPRPLRKVLPFSKRSWGLVAPRRG